jgi:predicted RNA-binding Zn-ribbon protein involved in translation (DUF1610 family)
MSSVDSLIPGDFIVVVGDRQAITYDVREFMTIPREPIYFSGVPLEVLAIGYPFLALKALNFEGVEKITLDIRRFEFEIVNKQYVEVFLHKEYKGVQGVIEKKEEKDTYRKKCPECGSHMVEVRSIDIFGSARSQKYKTWGFKCDTCGFEGACKKKELSAEL